MKRATVLALLADRDRATAEALAALQRLDDTTTGGITVRRLLDGLAALHGPGGEPAAPLVWRKGEAVPEWLVEGVQVRITGCCTSMSSSHVGQEGKFDEITMVGNAHVFLGVGVDNCCATALELVAPVPAAADRDVDAAEWKRRALDAEASRDDWFARDGQTRAALSVAEERISRAINLIMHADHEDPANDCTFCDVHEALRGES